MARLLVIGLDAAEISLIEYWRAQGALPNIDRLARAGLCVALESTAEALSGSVWPSITSGLLPGKHGRYYPLQPRPGHQGVQTWSATDVPSPFWSELSASGKRCVTVDVPFCPPGSRGRHVADWASYDKLGTPCSVPGRLLTDLIGRFGHHPLEASIRVPRGEADRQALLGALVHGVSIKAAVTQHLLTSEPWDFALVVFGETHAAGHFLSGPTDLSETNGRDRTGAASALQRVYMSIDEAIGATVTSAPSGTTVAVLSGHGIGPNPHGRHLLPAVLKRSGCLVTRGDQGNSERRWLNGGWLKHARQMIPGPVRELVSRRLPLGARLSLSSRWASADIDWSATRAFCTPSDLQGYVRINLRGREPEGIVEPGREYEELCAEISEVMNDLRDPASGERVVKQTLKVDHAFPGPSRDCLPDLIVVWAPGAVVETVASSRVGVLSAPSPDPRPGNHRATGFLIVAGPQTQPGADLRAGHVCDVAPTMLAFFGLAPGPHMDGRILPGVSPALDREAVAVSCHEPLPGSAPVRVE